MCVPTLPQGGSHAWIDRCAPDAAQIGSAAGRRPAAERLVDRRRRGPAAGLRSVRHARSTADRSRRRRTRSRPRTPDRSGPGRSSSRSPGRTPPRRRSCAGTRSGRSLLENDLGTLRGDHLEPVDVIGREPESDSHRPRRRVGSPSAPVPGGRPAHRSQSERRGGLLDLPPGCPGADPWPSGSTDRSAPGPTAG